MAIQTLQSQKNIFCDFDDIDCHALDSAKMQNLIARNDSSENSRNDDKTLTTKKPKKPTHKPPQNQIPTANPQKNQNPIDCRSF